MAEEIRIQRSDSVCLQFSVLNKSTELPLDIDDYEVVFSTENYDKTSVLNPLEVQKDVDSDSHAIILVYLKSTENNPTQSILHYVLKLYKPLDPTLFITGSTGDLLFVAE